MDISNCLVFCTVGPNCPAGYNWVPSLGRICLKIGNVVGGNNSLADIHSGYTKWIFLHIF